MAMLRPEPLGREQVLDRRFWANKPPPQAAPTAMGGVDPRVAEATRSRVEGIRANPTTPRTPTAGQPAPQGGTGLVRGMGKAVALADAVDRGTRAVSDFQQGDNLSGGYNALRAGAATMAARGNPVAAAFIAGSVAGDAINTVLPQSAKDKIGSGVNQMVRSAGKMLGRDWGVDDTALRRADGRLPPLSPEQQRSQEIINGPTQRGVVVPPLSGEQQAQALGNRTAAFNDLNDRLNSVPSNLPADLRDGAVYRSVGPDGRVTYSGVNVRENAQMFDGRENPLGRRLGDRGGSSQISISTSTPERAALAAAAQSGNMEGLTPLQQRQVALLRDGGTFDRFGNIMTRQTQETLARAAAQNQAQGREQSGPSLRQPVSIQDGVRAQVAALKSMGAKISMPTLRQIIQSETQRFNEQSGNNTSLATNAATNETTRRGQDVTAAEKRMEREASLRERQINADIWELSGRDPIRAADIALSMGRDPGAFMSVASNAQTLDHNAGRNAMTSLEPFMRPDKNGNITDAERARVRGIAESVVPGYFTMSERERREEQPRVNAALRLIQGLNDRNNTSWFQALGIDGDNPELTSIPDFGKGAKLSEVGLGEGIMTPGGVSRNDYKIQMANGRTVYLPRSAVNEEVLNFLAEMGVDIGKRNK